MKFLVKRTIDLSDHEKQSLRDLFAEVFSKPKPVERFERQFTKTVLGYSYHGMMLDDEDRLVGAYTSIPVRYEVAGSTRTFGLSVDTMIARGARGNSGNLRRLAEDTYERLAEDGIPFIFGFPNENIYAVRKRILRWKDIGTLDYYLLPLRPDRRKRWLLPLRPGFLLLAALLNSRVRMRTAGSNRERSTLVRKVDDTAFRQYRYGPEHVKGSLPDGTEFFYAVSDLDGTRVACIVDITSLTRHALEQAVAEICGIVGSSMDAIVYVGRLDERPANLFRLPERFWPKPVRMAGRILVAGDIDERIFSLDAWRVNLSDYDVA